MSDDYLWDGSGEPDPDVEKLETVLGRLRSNAPAPCLPAAAPSGRRWRGGVDPGSVLRRRFPFVRDRGRLGWQLAAAAVFATFLVGGGAWVTWRGRARAWEVASLQGTPLVGATLVTGSGTIAVGQWLETDGVSRARIRIGNIGQVTVEPNTRLRLVSVRQNDHRLALARGTLHASISAPPRLFFVETPSAVAADLGCRYTLQVDDSGQGILSVTTGWVSFEKEGRASFVPAGAICRTRPGFGPGTPYFEDAPAALTTSLGRLDFEPLEAHDRLTDLEIVLAQARPKDALTLWHLLRRARGEDRSQLYDRMAQLVPPPAGVTREGVLRGDDTMLDQWWEALGLGESLWHKAWRKIVFSLTPGGSPLEQIVSLDVTRSLGTDGGGSATR